MAIGVPPIVLTSGFSLTDGTVYTTLSVTPVTGRLYLLAVENVQPPGNTVVGPSIVGNDLTWVEDKSQIFQSGSSRIASYRSMGTPFAGVITLTFSLTQRRCAWILLELTGIDTGGNQGSGAIASTPVAVLNSSGAVTSLLATLPNFASADNMAIGFFGARRSAALSLAPGAGFTELVEVDTGLDAASENHGHILMAEYKLNDPSVDATYSASVQQNWAAGIALEIKAAAGVPQGGGGGTPGPGFRDPRDWPYPPDSQWNMPIGSGAVYEPTGWAGSPVADIQAYFTASDVGGNAGVEIWKTSDADPLKNVTIESNSLGSKANPDPTNPNFCDDLVRPVTLSVRVPTAAGSSLDPLSPNFGDNAILLIGPDNIAWELYQVRTPTAGGGSSTWSNAKALYKYDLTKWSGWSTTCQHGDRASFAGYMGGVLRAGELLNGIKHALAADIGTRALNSSGTGGKGYVWPAISADTGGYLGTSKVHCGSLLAIPYSIDVETIPYTSTGTNLEKVKNVARALQRYGLYCTGGTGFSVIMFSSWDSRAEIPYTSSAWTNDLNLLARTYLQVVTNNGPGSVGGGGTPLQPLAPAFGVGTATVPNAPIDLHSTAVGTTTVDVAMTNQDVSPNLATSTEWWWKRAADTVYTKITGRPAGENTFQFTGLPSSEELHIQAYKKNDPPTGGLSNPASVTGGGTFLIVTTTPTPDPAPAPIPVTTTPLTYNTIRIQAPDVAGETGYALEIRKEQGVWTLVDGALPVGGIDLVYTDPNPGSGGNKLQPRARTLSANGPSAWVEGNEVLTPTLAVPITGQTNFSPNKAAEWSKLVVTDAEADRLMPVDSPFSPAPFKNEVVMRITVSSLSAAKEKYLSHPIASMTEAEYRDVFALPTGFAGPAGDYFTFLQLHDSVNNKRLAAVRISGTGNTLQLDSEATGDTFPKTIVSAVTTNLLHAVHVRVKTGASGLIQVFYDDVLVLDLTGLTMTGWMANQARFLGVRVPPGWSGVLLARQSNWSDQTITAVPLSQPSAFPKPGEERF